MIYFISLNDILNNTFNPFYNIYYKLQIIFVGEIDFMMTEQKEESKGVDMMDFVIPQKVNAFCDSYVPVNDETLASEVFTDTKLRKYFQAYPRNIGDPLTWYIDKLECMGFNMQTSIMGEPAIFVRLMERKPTSLLEEAFE